MSDLENLQNRVVGAVEMLKRSQQDRQAQNHSLSRILNDLETKFEARTSELEHCRERIAKLEASNRALTELVGDMVQVIERAAHETNDDPVYRATATARDIVERYVGQVVANDESGEPETASEKATPEDALDEESVAPVQISATEAFSSASARFEDVSDDMLLAEETYEREFGADTFPRLVYDAVAELGGRTVESATETDVEDDAPIDIPVRAVAKPKYEAAPEKDLDIKEIMARLEIAAERAQLRADADARKAAIEPAVLERAVGGRA